MVSRSRAVYYFITDVMNIKISNWAIFGMIVLLGLLFIGIYKGCQTNKNNYAKFQKADSLNKAQSQIIKESKATTDSIKKEYQDSLEFVRGQYALLETQKERTENEMDIVSRQNKELIERYKLDKYEDTTAVTVPQGLMTDCGKCFLQLEKTNTLNLQYKSEMNKLEDNWNKQSSLYQNRFKKLEEERVGLYNKLTSITAQQKEALDKLKPRGRLYLSWGVLWQPWPVGAGAGLMYQAKNNMVYGLKGYYGIPRQEKKATTTIETSINFPLSLKRK